MITPMRVDMMGLKVVAMNRMMNVAGGWDGQQRLGSGDK